MRCEHVHKDDPENAVCEDCIVNTPAGTARGSRPYGSDRVEKSGPSPVEQLETLSLSNKIFGCRCELINCHDKLFREKDVKSSIQKILAKIDEALEYEHRGSAVSRAYNICKEIIKQEMGEELVK